jgi:polyphosphate kinase
MTKTVPPIPRMKRKAYAKELLALQHELVKLQAHMIGEGQKIAVIFEGRDAAGKDGTIKRIMEYMSPRAVRTVALPKPSDRDRASWYFQRYVPHLPANGEMMIFNRSWYNRAGVEPVMGFCTPAEHAAFLDSAPEFEDMLRQGGITLIKYWLDISLEEQTERMEARRLDPLKSWKISSIDKHALAKFDDYTESRNLMLRRTSTSFAPWMIARTNRKRPARIAINKDLLARFDYPGKDVDLVDHDGGIVFEFDPVLLDKGWLEG